MPTTYSDQFYLFDPAAPPPVGTSVSFSNLNLVDQDDDSDIGAAGGDLVNGSDVTNSWPGDTVTINVPGAGNVTYTGTTFYTADGGRYFTPTDGQVLENGTFVGASFVTTGAPMPVGNLGPPCFVSGTLIETRHGSRPIETIAEGDEVRTLDHGFQRVIWTGNRTVVGKGAFAPIRVNAGALGNNLAVSVSPQHRILVVGWRAEILFGEKEVLVTAKHLVNGDTIYRRPTERVRYHHILFDGHQLISAAGIWSESFFPGKSILREDEALRDELIALFPELLGEHQEGGWRTARRVIKAFEAKVLMTI